MRERRQYRSMLFTPAHIDKFLREPAASQPQPDIIVYDLEDGVPASHKNKAIKNLQDLLPTNNDRPLRLVRVSSPEPEACQNELQMVVESSLDGIVIPKAETAEQVNLFYDRLSALTASETDRDRLNIFLLIETSSALVNLQQTLKEVARVDGLIFGKEDFLADTYPIGLTRPANLETIHQLLVLNGASFKIPVIQSPFLNISNTVGFQDYTSKSFAEGFSGCLVVHPSQIKIANRNFSPTADEVMLAREILAEASTKPDDRAITFDNGKFLGPPLVKQAKRILKFTEG